MYTHPPFFPFVIASLVLNVLPLRNSFDDESERDAYTPPPSPPAEHSLNVHSESESSDAAGMERESAPPFPVVEIEVNSTLFIITLPPHTLTSTLMIPPSRVSHSMEEKRVDVMEREEEEEEKEEDEEEDEDDDNEEEKEEEREEESVSNETEEEE